MPHVKEQHLKIIAPDADIPANCRTFIGGLAGQWDRGAPYANLVITEVQNSGGCVFKGVYGWSAYQYDTRPGTQPIGPGTRLDGHMDGNDLVLGNISKIEIIVHPDLSADYYYYGRHSSHVQFQRIAPEQL